MSDLDFQTVRGQLNLLKKNIDAFHSILDYLHDREPSIAQVSGLAKFVETCYNFVEGSLRPFAKSAGAQLDDDSWHKDLLVWARSAQFAGMPLLPDGLELDSLRAARHYYKYQSLDMLLWEKLKPHVYRLPAIYQDLDSHLERVMTAIDDEGRERKLVRPEESGG